LGEDILKMRESTPHYVTELARKMRKEPTEAEALLWEAVRNNKLGFKFRFQHPLGRYIADLYCHEKKLVVEIDGGIHNIEDVIEYDKIRQAELESRGLRVLRIRNEEIRNNFQDVVARIIQAVHGC
jgi:very-short-patch-repair endonuclease